MSRSQRIFSCDVLRSDTDDNDMLLSASWPGDALCRQTTEPPRAPLHKPRDAKWKVSPLALSPTLHHLSRTKSGSEASDDWSSASTMLAEDDEPLVFTIDGAVVDEDEEDDDPEEEAESLFDIHMVGLDEPNLEVDETYAAYLEAPSVPSMFSRSGGLDSSPGRALLSALAQVSTASLRQRSYIGSKVEESVHPMDMLMAPSRAATTTPLRSRLQPLRAPLRRPAVAPLEVLPLLLPMSPKQLSPVASPRHLSHSGSAEALGKACDDVDEECLIFALDMDGEETAEADEEPVTPAAYLDLSSFELDGVCGSDVGTIDSHCLDEVTIRKVDSSNLGASPVLLSALEQVAADARGSNNFTFFLDGL